MIRTNKDNIGCDLHLFIVITFKSRAFMVVSPSLAVETVVLGRRLFFLRFWSVHVILRFHMRCVTLK
jgi:hypothetical protein